MAKQSTPQGGEPAAQPAPAAPPTQVTVTSGEVDEFVTRLIGRHGSKDAALVRLAGEQLRYRRRAQAAEATAADLQKKVPTAGSVVLTGDEAKAYQTLKDSGVTLDKVPETLKAYEGMKTEIAKVTRESNLAKAAGKKYDVSVLKTLLGDTELAFDKVPQMKEDKSGVEMVEVAFVMLPGKDGAKTKEALDTYLDREHASFKEVLGFKEPSESSSEERPRGTQTPTLPRQTVGGPPKKKESEGNKALKRVLGSAMTPSQRRKESTGSAS